MSEKDDILGLAFLVGGAIHDLKQNTVGDGKFVSGSLPDPANFVRNVAAQDISKVVAENKAQAQAAGGPPTPAGSPQPQGVPAPLAEDVVRQLLPMLTEIREELRKITNRMGI